MNRYEGHAPFKQLALLDKPERDPHLVDELSVKTGYLLVLVALLHDLAFFSQINAS